MMVTIKAKCKKLVCAAVITVIAASYMYLQVNKSTSDESKLLNTITVGGR